MRSIKSVRAVSTLAMVIAATALPQAAQARGAQDQAAQPDPRDKTDAAPAANAQAAANANDIVVTAERKPQTLQKYAGTATVVSGQQLKETGVQSVADLQGRVPGLQILPNNNNLEVYIRGVGSSNNTELGDPAAGTHYDGVYIPRPSGFGSIFFDIDRVEVNFGPQGTLRGRNATAGTVNIIPWHPGLNVFDAYVEGGIGNYGQKSIEGMINLPVTHTIAIRLSGEHLEHDTYTHNVGPVRGLRGPEWENNWAGRAQLLFKPSDQFDMLLSYDHTLENGGGTIGTNLASAEGQNVDISNLNLRDVYLYPIDPHQHTFHNGEKGDFNYHARSFNAELILSHRHLDTDWLGASPGLVAYPGGLDIANHGNGDGIHFGDSTGNIATNYSHYETQGRSNSGTQELRFTAPAGARFDWTVGGFRFTESQASFLGSVADQNAYFQGIEFNTRTKSNSFAVYTDDTFHVDDKLSLTAGLRYTEDRKRRTGVAARYLLALGAGDYNCCMGPILGTPGFAFTGLGRTNYTLPDGGPNSAQQALDFYLGGIKSFGVNDTVPTIFPNGQLPTVPTGPCVPNPATPWLQCAANGLYTYATIDAGEFFAQNASDKYHFFDWRLRAQYDINRDHMVYGLVATGNKAGGFNDNFGTGGIAPTYRPERLTNFEVGTKNRFNVGGLPAHFNIAGFYEDYHDQVLSSLLSIAGAADFLKSLGRPVTLDPNFAAGAIIVNFNYNAANSAIAGAQFDAGISIPRARLNLSLNGVWLPVAKVMSAQMIEDFRFQSDIDPRDAGFRSIEDKRLPRVPRIQLNAQISQKFETSAGTFDWVVTPGYHSGSYATIFNGEDYAYTACQSGGTVTDTNGNPVAGCDITTTYRGQLNDRVKGFWTVDLGAGYTSINGKWRLEGYVNNALNTQQIGGILISQAGGTVAFLPRPRTFGARLHVRF